MSEKETVPMIPKHQHQAEVMHMSWTIRWLVIAIVIGFVSMVVMAYIFVNGYTSRTKDWLNTYAQLSNQTVVTEVTNEKDSSGNVQQLSLP